MTGDETGQALTSATADVLEPTLVPGTYRGDVVLTVSDANDIAYQGTLWPFRQALYECRR